jgi:hypothetical protein
MSDMHFARLDLERLKKPRESVLSDGFAAIDFSPWPFRHPNERGHKVRAWHPNRVSRRLKRIANIRKKLGLTVRRDETPD